MKDAKNKGKEKPTMKEKENENPRFRKEVKPGREKKREEETD